MAAVEQLPGELSKSSSLVKPQAGSGSWAWILQRCSAVLLIIFLGTHWYISHYAALGESLTFERIGIRLQNPVLVFVDAGMLLIVIYHALNGVRNVILDFNIGQRWERILAIILIVFGIVVFFYGMNALLPFTTGSALFYR